MLRVLAIASDNYGVGKFRVLDPFKYIGNNFSDEIHVDITFNTENDNDYFLKYDVVIFNLYIHQLSHEVNIHRVKWLKKRGIKVIMDVDDYWMPDKKHPMYFVIQKNKLSEKKLELMSLVDYITTTTPIFAEIIENKIKNKNVIIFPNAVDETESQFIPNPTLSDKVRFSWIGGSSHKMDIELLSDGINNITTNYKDKVQFLLCGFDTRGNIIERNAQNGQEITRPIKPSETVWYEYEKIFTKNYTLLDRDYKDFLLRFENIPYNDENKIYRRRWTQDITKYALNYNLSDVSLIPLVDNLFNSSKSQLKVIESGFHKKAIICSNVKPYTLDLINAVDNGQFNKVGNSLLVDSHKNHKDWAKHMKRLIENPDMIKELGEKLYLTVKDKYSLRKVSKDRVEFLKTLKINN